MMGVWEVKARDEIKARDEVKGREKVKARDEPKGICCTGGQPQLAGDPGRIV